MKRKPIGRYMLRVALTLWMLCFLSGCGERALPEDSPAELWIVMESSGRYGMSDLAGELATQFEAERENVTVRLDILPADAEERAAYLEALRTQIMGGGGPDGYVLPAAPYTHDPLFADVTQCMYNGIFYDVSALYDADTALDTGGLVQPVMNAGVVNGKRYVLPLRFDMPVVFVDEEGLDPALFSTGILDVMDAVLASGDGLLAQSIQNRRNLVSFAMNIFPNVIDHQNQSVTLTEEELTGYLRRFQSMNALMGEKTPYMYINFPQYCKNEGFWMLDGHSVFVGDMEDTLLNAAAARELRVSLAMYPMVSLDGTVVADVTYYCAVGAGSVHPELTYEYLRLFLTEDAQWEKLRSGVISTAEQRLTAESWPVRAEGATGTLWQFIKSQHSEDSYSQNGKTDQEAINRSNRLLKVQLTDADIFSIWEQIDTARFSLEAELELYVLLTEQLNDPKNGNAPLDTDLEALAQAFIQSLQWRIAEG